MRVCQFRHDGKWTSTAATRKPPHQEDLHFYSTGAILGVKLRLLTRISNFPPTILTVSEYSVSHYLKLSLECCNRRRSQQVKGALQFISGAEMDNLRNKSIRLRGKSRYLVDRNVEDRIIPFVSVRHSYSSFAFIVIFAFSTFDTGHPFSAASAYF